MLYLFDPDKLLVNIQGGALEKHEPSEEIKEICTKVEELRKVVEAKQKEIKDAYDKFVKEEVDPKRKEIQAQIMEVNKKNNPELEKLMQQQKPQIVK